MRLTDEKMKVELGIGPMGHRAALLDAVSALADEFAGQQAGGDGTDGGYGGSRPRSAAPGRARPMSAVPGKPMGPRRPASASPQVIPPDPYLGPALGKVTVYEQRAKLLFELDRAEARAAQHRALAEQLHHTAHLSSEEVAHLRGLVQDLERKNKAALAGAVAGTGSSGGGGRGLDHTARIPWNHVGSGTKLQNWNPERYARPGDPPTVDLTFQPKISRESRKLLREGGYGEGGSGADFLARLSNDSRKRDSRIKELESKYYNNGQDPGASKRRFDQDFELLSGELQRRCNAFLDKDPESYNNSIDDCVDALSTSANWRDAGLKTKPIKAASGPAKVAAAAGAIRTLMFMERYRTEQRSREEKAKALEKKWIEQTLGAQYMPGAKDQADLDEACQYFALLGWRDGDGEESITDDRLNALLERACEFRTRYDSWWERARNNPAERAVGFRCDVDWDRDSRFAADGLARLMEAEARRSGGDSGAADGATGGPGDYVSYTVQLLGRCRADDLRKLKEMSGRPKRLAAYRAVRTRKFIEHTEQDLEERDAKLRSVYEAMRPPKRVIPHTQVESFFERLLDDASKRRSKTEKMANDKMSKEQELLASSVMYGRNNGARPRSGRR